MSTYSQFFGGGSSDSPPVGGGRLIGSSSDLVSIDGAEYLRSGVLSPLSENPEYPPSFTYPSGEYWFPVTGTFGYLCSCQADNGTVVFGGNAGSIAVTTDGIDFTTTTIGWSDGTGNNPAINGLTYYGGVYVAVGASGCIATSSDALSWTQQASLSTGEDLYAVTYGAGVFVAVGQDSHAYLSADSGASWTDQGVVGNGYGLRDIIYAESNFFAVGLNGTIAHSNNGHQGSWSINASTDFGTDHIFSITHDGSYLYAAGGGGKACRSSTGRNAWVSFSTFTSNAIYGINYSNDTLFISAAGGNLISGPDYTDLSTKTVLGMPGNFDTKVHYVNDVYVVSANTLYASEKACGLSEYSPGVYVRIK